ncbi:two-pore calcium channel [Stylonychia lemnae]|uniref:Two-pore calcium channel n=1 Tax=Stylonychia lemnae TaxID=5949 RepID=A0A077ZSB1_STYLE|nr:two-pore calcium channel [Stylonychia lemnae]|eukprot:CDW71336.1 two-pore calcium channel [Stylonychia lemnae]
MSVDSRANSNINSEKLIYAGDVNTQHIMMMIDKGIKKNIRMIKTDRGKLARKIYVKLNFLRNFTLLGLVILMFFEKPDWCLRDPNLKDTNSCNAEGLIPNSGIPYFSPTTSKILQLVLILILLLFQISKRMFLKQTRNSERYFRIQFALSVLIYLDVFLSFVIAEYPFPWIAALLRNFLLVIIIKIVRETWRRFIQVVIDSFQMVLFIIIYIMFFAYLGMRLFLGTVEGVQYFETYVDSLYNMLVLLTTSNFPDIMLPAYQYSRVLSLYFIIFLLIGLFLILNLLMAVFYNNYKNRYEEQLIRFVEQRNLFLDKKFNELDKESKGYLNKQETYEMFKQIHLLDVQEDQVNIKQEHFDHMFYLLDSIVDNQNQGKIFKQEFMKIFEVYELWKYEWTQSNFFDQRTDIQSTRSSGMMIKTSLRSIIRSLNYEYVLNIIAIFQFSEIAFRDRFYSDSSEQIDIWLTIQTIINFFFSITLILDWIYLGLQRSYQKHPRVLVETLCLIFFIVGIIQWAQKAEDPSQIYSENYLDFTFMFNVIKIFEIVAIVRVLRLSIYLYEVRSFRIIIEALRTLLVPFSSLLSVQFSLFYFYALLGMLMFGGKVRTDSPQIRNNDSTPDLYSLNNFNDMISSYVTLFELMVVNNWYISTEMYVNISGGNNFVLLYFVTFYNWGVLVGLNIIVAFAIDMYGAVERLDKQKSKHEEKLYKLAQQVKKTKRMHVIEEEATLTESEETVLKNEDFVVKRKKTLNQQQLLEESSRINSSERESFQSEVRNLDDYFDVGLRNNQST